MNELLTKIKDNPLNKKVIQFLKLDFTNEPFYFKNWAKSGNGFDEGGITLFDRFGKNIPIECKFSIDIHNIMVFPKTGEIFAFHTGRYSIFIKCDFEFFNLTNSDNFRKGYTFDCIKDITILGEEWAFIDNFSGQEYKHIERIYKVIKKRNANNVYI